MAAWWHTAVVIVLVAVTAIRGTYRAAELRATAHPDRLSIYWRTILFEWLLLGLVLAGVWLHGSSVYSVLGNRWRSARRCFEDFGIGLVFLIASIMVSSIIQSHAGVQDGSTQFLLPQGRTEMAVWIVLSITAGICEEALYRGYLQKQFIALTRNVPGGIILSALAFGSAHLYQGWLKATPIAITAVLAGALAHWRRSVRPGMVAHALQDVLGGFIRH